VDERALVQGLRATLPICGGKQGGDRRLRNAVCCPGCVVPWNGNENKFMCPCHGSQYDRTGKVVRGPAPLSLPLVHAKVEEDKIN